jgi:hypothetical protein
MLNMMHVHFISCTDDTMWVRFVNIMSESQFVSALCCAAR